MCLFCPTQLAPPARQTTAASGSERLSPHRGEALQEDLQSHWGTPLCELALGMGKLRLVWGLEVSNLWSEGPREAIVANMACSDSLLTASKGRMP